MLTGWGAREALASRGADLAVLDLLTRAARSCRYAFPKQMRRAAGYLFGYIKQDTLKGVTG